MLRLLRVAGESMSPGFREGDFVLVCTIPFLRRRLRPGDVIAFRHPEQGIMIKGVAEAVANGKGYHVLGTHPDSVDSRRFGPVPLGDVIGKVIWHIRRR